MKRNRFTSDYVFETATSDAGMTKKEQVLFHAFNRNGARMLLPDHDAFVTGTTWHAGLESIYGRLDNWAVKQLLKIATGETKRFTQWDVTYLVSKIRQDAAKAPEAIAKKRASLVEPAAEHGLHRHD
jgi:hypothetical protein